MSARQDNNQSIVLIRVKIKSEEWNERDDVQTPLTSYVMQNSNHDRTAFFFKIGYNCIVTLHLYPRYIASYSL